MINLVYLVPSLKNVGPTQQLYYIIKFLDRKIFNITLITFSNKNFDEELQKFEKLNLKIIQLNMHSFYGLLFGFVKIKYVLKEVNPDIVHTHLFRADLISGFCLKKYKRVATVRGELTSSDHYIQKFGYLLGTVYTKLHTLALKKIYNVVSISNAVKNDLEKNGIESTLIHNGIDLNRYKVYNNTQKEDLRQQFGIAHDKKVFISIGSLIKLKRPNILIDAFLKADVDNSILLVIGLGDMYDSLSFEYRGFDNIKFIGFSKEIDSYLGLSDYFLSSSSTEGLPNTVLEASATGIPCILSNIEPHKEILPIDKKSEFLFELDNVEDFVTKIKDILKKDYCGISSEFRQNIEIFFDAGLINEKYQKLYMELV